MRASKTAVLKTEKCAFKDLMPFAGVIWVTCEDAEFESPWAERFQSAVAQLLRKVYGIRAEAASCMGKLGIPQCKWGMTIL
jgi:hypothetical protein